MNTVAAPHYGRWLSPWPGSFSSLAIALVKEPVFYAYALMYMAASMNFVEVFYVHRDIYADWGNLDINTTYASAAKILCLTYILILLLARFTSLVNSPVVSTYTCALFAVAAISFSRSFNYSAAVTAGTKDIVPYLLLLLGFAYRRKPYVFIYAIMALAIINNMLQIAMTYPLQMFGVLTGRSPFGGSAVFRAAGITDTGLYEFLNFSAIVFAAHLCRRRRPLLVLFFSVFGLLALLAKSFPIFLIYATTALLALARRDARIKLLAALLGLVTLSAAVVFDLVTPAIQGIARAGSERIDIYAIKQTADRTQSYVALHDSIRHANLFGEGLGAFGGPASVIYDSPLHYQYISRQSQLITADTYYPHVFIEYGLLGGSVFMLMFFLPLLTTHVSRTSFRPFGLLLGFTLYSAVFSFAIEDVFRGMCVFPLLFPLLMINRSSVLANSGNTWPKRQVPAVSLLRQRRRFGLDSYATSKQ